MTSKLQRRIRALPSLALVFLMVGCGSIVGGSGAQRTGHNSPPGPAAITLWDPSPDQLIAQVYIGMGGYDAQSRATTRIGVSFQTSKAPVHIVGSATLTCNGRVMSLAQPMGEPEVFMPTATAAGQDYSCTYHVGQTTSTFTFTIPQPVVILTPQDGAQLSRSAAVPLSYQASGQVNPLATGPNGMWGPCTALSNATRATCDTRKLPQGSGTIRLTEYVSLQPEESGPPFQAVIIAVDNMTAVLVTWV